MKKIFIRLFLLILILSGTFLFGGTEEQYSNYFTRSKDVLKLNIGDYLTEFWLTNSLQAKYVYAKFIKEINCHLIWVLAHEDFSYLLVGSNSGAKIWVPGVPILSPKTNFLLSIAESSPYGPEGQISIFSVLKSQNTNNFSLRHDYWQSLGSLRAFDAVWISNDAFQLKISNSQLNQSTIQIKSRTIVFKKSESIWNSTEKNP